MKTFSALILAAGKGTRMQSDLPKVAHEIAGEPMVRWVVRACAEAGCSRIVVVVGYQQQVVRDALAGLEAEIAPATIEFAVQNEQLGTGHAVIEAKGLFETERSEPGHGVLVLAGDGPLIRAGTLAQIKERHETSGAAATMATSRIDDPTGYGRIVRDQSGKFVEIVEQKNATPQQLAINEINPSYYLFDCKAMFDALDRVERNPVSGEYYITDVPAMLLGSGMTVEVVEAVPPADVLSINTPEQLAEVDRIMRSRLETARKGGN
jgi:bifunctional UDP-N-acetylglucosamine pyrophosphorylase / glucosamine-1-phosphate N-acetyltransferase